MSAVAEQTTTTEMPAALLFSDSAAAKVSAPTGPPP